jgi:hypothetical protein
LVLHLHLLPVILHPAISKCRLDSRRRYPANPGNGIWSSVMGVFGGFSAMKLFRFLSILFAFAFSCILITNADTITASIRGTVTDQTGAVVSGAKLTARNTQTGLAYTIT